MRSRFSAPANRLVMPQCASNFGLQSRKMTNSGGYQADSFASSEGTSDLVKSSSGATVQMHIAIVHFSGPPAIGGIERLIAAQARTLSRIGQHVRVIVGGGDDCPAAETIMIAQLNPAHDGVVAARSALSSAFPRRDHPLVRSLGQALERALAGCDACWVHNLFTVYLNPFATVALW